MFECAPGVPGSAHTGVNLAFVTLVCVCAKSEGLVDASYTHAAKHPGNHAGLRAEIRIRARRQFVASGPSSFQARQGKARQQPQGGQCLAASRRVGSRSAPWILPHSMEPALACRPGPRTTEARRVPAAAAVTTARASEVLARLSRSIVSSGVNPSSTPHDR